MTAVASFEDISARSSLILSPQLLPGQKRKESMANYSRKLQRIVHVGPIEVMHFKAFRLGKRGPLNNDSEIM